MRWFVLLCFFCLFAVISAKKHVEENIDAVEPETKEHSAKKYTKEHQKSHGHGHKHKKQHHVAEEQPIESEPIPKKAPIEIPEAEIELQENIETSKKVVNDQKLRDQTEDLHLQDLTYEENLKKDKKKKGHHGAHQAETLERNARKKEKKLFAEQEENPIDERVIEDSFEPLQDKAVETEKKGKTKDKKSKDKSKNKKKASEKNKDKHNKKSKDGKKKSKDGKNKNKKDKKRQ